MIVEYIHSSVDEASAKRLTDALAAVPAGNYSPLPAAARGALAQATTDQRKFVARIEGESSEAIERFKSIAGFDSVAESLAPYSSSATLDLL